MAPLFERDEFSKTTAIQWELNIWCSDSENEERPAVREHRWDKKHKKVLAFPSTAEMISTATKQLPILLSYRKKIGSLSNI